MPELEAPSTEPAAAATTWPLHDYTSPGLRVVRPDSAFPHMRPGDPLHHPWKYLRRDVPHIWYADERFPLMGFMNRDEAVLLHNIALQFAGKPALEIGSWLGWSTVHLALGGVELDVIDPAHDDPVIRASVEDSLHRAGVRANLVAGRSPESIAALGKKWSLFFVDGDHEAPSPMRDARACLPYATEDCAFVFHDLASPAVAAGLRLLEEKGFNVVIYQTAQIMGLAWRGNVTPVAHTPDPDVAWQLPPHLAGLPISGVDFDPGARRSYKQLRDQIYTSDESRPSVCIVTSELIGPFKNGGVGTSMTGLAELLASDGLPVTVLYTGTVWAPEIKLERWKKHYAARGIELEALSIDGMKSLAGPLRDCGFGIPSLVYDYLSRRRFDVIHFNDCCGEGSLALAAKKLGLAFEDSLLVVALHSPSRWVFELNHVLPDNRLAAAFDYGERLSLACADVLWSPSEYLLDWVSAHRFELPEQTFVQQYVMPAAGYPEVTHGRTSIPNEIVFFGRLEERKGLRLFCNAIDALRDELAARNITVTFLGKPETCAGMPSLDYIATRALHWQFPIRTLTSLGQPEALQYLRDGAKLAVMPSPFDNSPCTVYEALASGIPFLATRTGGIPELVADDDRDRVLFDHSTAGLRNALLDAIEHGGWIAKPAISQDDTRASWRAMHAHWQSLKSRAPLRAIQGPLPSSSITAPTRTSIARTHRSHRRRTSTATSSSIAPKTRITSWSSMRSPKTSCC
jgi:glycosyltransferase involved in cell wall biosynthesis